MSGDVVTCFSQESSLPPMQPCRLMTARTRRVSQSIIEVEAKSLDDSTSAEQGQGRLPIAERGPAVEENIYQKVSSTFVSSNGASKEL